MISGGSLQNFELAGNAPPTPFLVAMPMMVTMNSILSLCGALFHIVCSGSVFHVFNLMPVAVPIMLCWASNNSTHHLRYPQQSMNHRCGFLIVIYAVTYGLGARYIWCWVTGMLGFV